MGWTEEHPALSSFLVQPSRRSTRAARAAPVIGADRGGGRRRFEQLNRLSGARRGSGRPGSPDRAQRTAVAGCAESRSILDSWVDQVDQIAGSGSTVTPAPSSWVLISSSTSGAGIEPFPRVVSFAKSGIPAESAV